MTDIAPTPTAPASLPEVSARMADELARLEVELDEVDLLVAQARTEAGRHETRRAAAGEKVTAATTTAASSGSGVDPAAAAELNAQLVLLTKRAALMESQVDVLEGKRRALGRYRDALAGYSEALSAFGDVPFVPRSDKPPLPQIKPAIADPNGTPPAVSRLLLGAQEDLRREIARAMHDGPAQSLTNIVLQAQIVERLVATDPTRATSEVRQLVAMVQQTLEATKSFIFDVRPMVLDDLGLVPTLRRAARERGRRAGVPVEFDSMGSDRRLPMDLESGLFRILDEAMAAYLGARADRVSVKLDWNSHVEARVSASRAMPDSKVEATPEVVPDADLPPALAAMMEDRRADARDAVEAAKRNAIVVLPPSTWREIQSRAATLGMEAELSPDGAELRLVAEVPGLPQSSES
ncbi:MAG TPA: histidine kinase [Candidatus Limnocylindrales bacterium]|nr:histidine kinase [Candidatus Limnocylindrales bacterium]